MKTKTFTQIYEQWQRLREYSISRGCYERVCNTAVRYQKNIKLHLHYFPSELGIYDEGKENTPVPASIYTK